MNARKGAINVGVAVVLCLVVAGIVFGVVQYNKYKERRELEAQRQLAEERARAERADAERKAEEERRRKEAEEHEAKLRREREEREAKLKKEQQERLEKAREAEEARQKAAEAEAAKANYNRARDAFANGATAFFSDVPEASRIDVASGIRWYVDESFSKDGRIYEIKDGTIAILRPESTGNVSDGATLLASIVSKPGLLAADENVWICGTGESLKSYAVPAKGKSIVPLDCEFGAILDTALSLGVKPPANSYGVSLKMKRGGMSIDVGAVEATEPISRNSLEDAVRKELSKRFRGNKRMLTASAVEDYLAACEVVVKRKRERTVARGTEDESKRQDKSPLFCYKCHGKGTVVISVRETCDECGGTGVIEQDVVLRNKKWGDSRWGEKRKHSKTRSTCQKCRRSGKVSVKKDVECPICHGSGQR